MEDCQACVKDSETLFWDRRREDCRRFAALLDRMKLGEVEEEGGEEEEGCHGFSSTTFDIEKRKRQAISQLMETGHDAIFHSCDFGGVLGKIDKKPFLEKGRGWVTEGKKGFKVGICLTIKGVVDGDPPGRWIHTSQKRFVLYFPKEFHQVLGETMEISGEFIMVGEKPLRQKKTRVGFVEKTEGLAFANVPPNTQVEIFWEESLLRAPFSGLRWWGVEAVVLSWEELE